MQQPEHLVLGGGGFIGSNVVRHLVESGKTARVGDTFATGRRSNLEPFKDSVDVHEADIRDPQQMRDAMQGIKHVMVFAALPSVVRSIEAPVLCNDVNVNGLLNVLEAARETGVERVIFSSSSSVYGDSDVLPKVETMTPKPKSPYAAQKLMGEHYARLYFELYGLKTFCLRYFNVFGPRQNPKSDYAAVIPLFIRMVLAGESPTIEGDGLQSRDFTYVDDVVRANLACCEAGEEAAGKAYNAAQGGRITVLDLAHKIAEIVDPSVKPVHVASRKGDVKHSQADARLAKEFLGWEAQVDFEEGLRTTIDWVKNEE